MLCRKNSAAVGAMDVSWSNVHVQISSTQLNNEMFSTKIGMDM